MIAAGKGGDGLGVYGDAGNGFGKLGKKFAVGFVPGGSEQDGVKIGIWKQNGE